MFVLVHTSCPAHKGPEAQEVFNRVGEPTEPFLKRISTPHQITSAETNSFYRVLKPGTPTVYYGAMWVM